MGQNLGLPPVPLIFWVHPSLCATPGGGGRLGTFSTHGVGSDLSSSSNSLEGIEDGSWFIVRTTGYSACLTICWVQFMDNKKVFDIYFVLKWAGFLLLYSVSPKKDFVKNLELCEQRNRWRSNKKEVSQRSEQSPLSKVLFWIHWTQTTKYWS